MQALAEQSRVVRIPLNRVGSLNKLNRTFAQLEQKFQREPSADELAEVLQIHPDEITDTIKMGSRQVSVHAPFVHGEENGLLDVLEDESQATPDSALIDDSLQKDIKRSLSKLSDKEADVISRYFGLNGETTMTLDEIGEVLEITRERVRQIKEKGIQKLRNSNKSKALKSYLG